MMHSIGPFIRNKVVYTVLKLGDTGLVRPVYIYQIMHLGNGHHLLTLNNMNTSKYYQYLQINRYFYRFLTVFPSQTVRFRLRTQVLERSG